MHRFLVGNHAPVLSVSKELKTWLAVISLTLLATQLGQIRNPRSRRIAKVMASYQ